MNLICILHIVYSYIFLMFLKIKNIIKTLNYLYNLTWARHSLISTGILLEWFSQVRVLACDSPGRHSNEHWLHELQVLHDIPDRGFLTSKKIKEKNVTKIMVLQLSHSTEKRGFLHEFLMHKLCTGCLGDLL